MTRRLRAEPMRAEADGWFALEDVTGTIVGFSGAGGLVVQSLLLNDVEQVCAPIPVDALLEAFIEGRSGGLGFECVAVRVRVRFERCPAHAAIVLADRTEQRSSPCPRR